MIPKKLVANFQRFSAAHNRRRYSPEKTTTVKTSNHRSQTLDSGVKCGSVSIENPSKEATINN
jgi:hypothetical protein